MKIASWNVNSIRARLDHVTAWLKARKPDVLLVQELKGTEFPATVFEDLGYESVAVTQKTYNGVAILSRHPIETISTALAGDEADSHARYLETRKQEGRKPCQRATVLSTTLLVLPTPPTRNSHRAERPGNPQAGAESRKRQQRHHWHWRPRGRLTPHIHALHLGGRGRHGRRRNVDVSDCCGLGAPSACRA